MRKLLVVAWMLVAAGVAFARAPKLAPDITRPRSGPNVDVIVQFRNPLTARSHAAVSGKGGVLRRSLGLVRAGAYSVPYSALDGLASDPSVAYISPDRPVASNLDYATTAAQADIVWRTYGLDGAGVGVALIDSGLLEINDLQTNSTRTIYHESFLPMNASAKDVYGHGTHVAGIIAGSGKNSSGSGFTRTFRGMAPNVNILNLRVLDDMGSGKESSVIAAIQRAVALKNTYNVRVINLSLGRPVRESYRTDPLCQAVEAAWKAGIVVVVAAGNEGRNDTKGTDGYGTIGSPANDPFVITVGATKTMRTMGRGDDLAASYSSKGPTSIDHIVKPDIVAAGNKIVSTYKTGFTLTNTNPLSAVPMNYYKSGANGISSNYLTLSGTSMAAPVVSGAVALMLQNNPALTPDQVKARLMKTAYRQFPAVSTTVDPVTNATYTTHHDVFTIGTGQLDLAAALANQDLIVGSAMSPTAVYNPVTRTVRLVSSDAAVTGGTAIWGDALIWGDTAIWGDTTIWGNTAIWGDSASTGFTAVWGDTAIWGETAIWGDTLVTSESMGISIRGDD